MGDTSIEWTDKTWNPVTGCTKVSQGCKNCYAEKIYERFNGKGSFKNVICHEDRLMQPLRWKHPAKVFVNSMSDLFHENVPFEFIDKVFAVMAMCQKHTFQVLTKRADRMLEYFKMIDEEKDMQRWINASIEIDTPPFAFIPLVEHVPYPLPNVWIGVSVEDQKAADERIPLLLQIPATVRFLSCEPLLGAVDLTKLLMIKSDNELKPDVTINSLKGWHGGYNRPERTKIDWVICGGESGNKARPMHPDWARSLRDQCNAADVAFFFKQWGEWQPIDHGPKFQKCTKLGTIDLEGQYLNDNCIADPKNGIVFTAKCGKKAAGRLLDGKEWNEMPVQS